jgi:hypothetical protein
LNLERYGWLRVTWSTEGEGTEGPSNPTGDTLIDVTSGTLGGTPLTRIHLRRPAPVPPSANGASPFGEGPFGRYGLYGFTDAGGSQLHRLDLLTGIDTTVLRDGRVIHRAVYDPHADADYIAFLDSAHRTDLGIWRFRPGVDDVPTRLEAPTGLADAGTGPYRRLYLTPSGDVLVVVDCSLPSHGTTFDCTARSIDTAGGRLLHAFGDVPERITAVTDRWLIVEGRALALDGGASRALPATCGETTVTRVGADDVVVFESSGPGCGRTFYELTALDLDTGTSRVVYAKRDFLTSSDPGLVPFEEHVALPSGFVLLSPSNVPASPDAGPGFLLAVADGSLAELPAWPPPDELVLPRTGTARTETRSVSSPLMAGPSCASATASRAEAVPRGPITCRRPSRTRADSDD